MKSRYSFLSLFLVLTFILSSFGPWALASDNPLPAGLTPQEREQISQDFQGYLRGRYGLQDAQRNTRSGFNLEELERPQGKIVCPGEHEMAEGICFSWSGYTTILTRLIAEVSKVCKAYVGISSSSIETARRRLEQGGANMNNVEFISTRLDSIWMRDFGPHTIVNGDGNREILDLIYNRPRPNDDKFPTAFAQYKKMPVHYPRLILPGGNLIQDGHGVAIMTDVTFDSSQGGDPNLTVPQLEKLMADYFGNKKVIIIRDMNDDGTGHVDMFCKLLTDRDIIVGQYAKPSDGAYGNYDILNEAAERLANEKNGKGESFIVHRIPMPKYRYGTTRTYTNSLIANKLVLVPVYGDQETEKTALDVYRKILPNHNVVGVDCNDIISANGAIHCITMQIPGNSLKIAVVDQVIERADGTICLKAEIDSEKGILEDEKPSMFWKTDGDESWACIDLELDNDGYYYGILPHLEKGTEIRYFLQVEDNDGTVAVWPKNAPEKTLQIRY